MHSQNNFGRKGWYMEGKTKAPWPYTQACHQKVVCTQMNTSTKQKQTHRYREQAYGCQGRGCRGVDAGGGKDREFGISRCKLLYIGWINKVLLYSTGNYIQYPVINHNGKRIYMCINFAVQQKLTQHCKSTILQ